MKWPDQITLELKNIIYLIPNQHNCTMFKKKEFLSNIASGKVWTYDLLA